jgi:predicted  nucleic acid-binding Zn-ribbon protein
MPARPIAPAATLTIERAARLAGVPEDELWGRMQAGELLYESGRGRSSTRRGGEGDVLVRAVDLAALYPKVRLKSAGSPVSRPKERPWKSPGPTPSPPKPANEVPAARSIATPIAPQSAPPLAGPTVDVAGALTSRLDAIETASGDLRTQLTDLRSQRQDLVTQCDDLRSRLDRAERERQASTAGLILAQSRILELEAPVVAVDPPWRRRTTYALGAVVVLLAFFLRQQVVQASAMSDHVTSLSDDVRERDVEIEDLGGQLPRMTRALTELDSQLARTRAEAHAERGALLETLEQQRVERSAAQGKAQRELEALRAEQRETRSALEGDRELLAADQARWAAEREAEAQGLVEREVAMQALVEQCMRAVETLANRPVRRAATGFVGRIVERLEGPDQGLRGSQGVQSDG